ncbi:MAG: adenylate cyclase [Gemmataceae bacterium]|nr:adenylate cyclase [Gemmataceae bacterium]
MLTQPRFKPHFRVQVVPGEGVFVLTDTAQTLLKGRLYEQIVPHVDGRPADDLCDQLLDEVSAAEVYYILGQLERRGYLCDKDGSLSAEEAAFWSAQQVDPSVAARRLAETPVAVRGFGVDPEAVCELLQASHVRVTGGESLGVVLADGYLRAELGLYNTQSLAAGRPWLLARPVGRQVWVGPLFRPGATGCWECLAQRLRANRPVETYLNGKNGSPGGAPERAASPASRAAALGLIATAVATWVARRDLPALDGKIQTFDLASWQVRSHTLVRLPHCRACGSDTPTGTFQPVSLEGRTKVVAQDGGHRTVPPEVTLERFGHHVSPLTGAVTMLERVGPTADGAMHVYLAGTNLARRHHSLEHLRGDLRNMSSGKGVTDTQARASGLCEGLERYSGVFRGDEIRRRARLRDLGDDAIHPNSCLLFSERQYREREDRNAGNSLYGFVPVEFDPDAEVEWTPVWSLTRRETRYLPTAFCYFDYAHSGGDPFCIADSNGNAAGNTAAEAILQGFFELAERDAVALWWYNRVRRPGVDLGAFGDPYPARLRDALQTLGRNLWALDLTSDLGVPVFAALSRSTAGPEEQIVLGFGAHLDPSVALLRALTEMNQMLAALIGQADRGKPADADDEETARWLRTATVANQPYLLPNDDPPRIASAYPRAWTDDVAGDVRACQAIVEQLGLEMLVLDQTRPEIGLPVAKVIVPGLRHFWARFAPGRLYDVPVRLGWLSHPLTEEELNPIPMFL